MNIQFRFLVALLAAPLLMGFDASDPWEGLEGEWAYQTADNCEGEHSLDFTYDYRRDRHGNLIYPNDQPPSRRDRFATVMTDGQSGYRSQVGDTMTLTDAGTRLHLNIRRPTLLPFRGFGDLVFEVVDDNTLREHRSERYGQELARAIGRWPILLVRCP